MSIKGINNYQQGDEINLFMLITQVEKRVTKTNKNYLAMELQDKSGEIRGNYWGATDEDIKKFKSGTVVWVSGLRDSYQGNPQIKFKELRLADEDEPNDPILYKIKSDIDVEKLKEEINQAVFEIQIPEYNRIVRQLLKTYEKDFYLYPAAKKNHHAYESGLVYHTVSILRLGIEVAKQYPEINKSLLLSGIILHDLGKVIELSGVNDTQYTLTGNLLGHIVILDEEIVKTAEELGVDNTSERLVLLRHLILAHHGLKEYGSPVEPKILEAVVLHKLDDLDAQIQMVKNSLKSTDPGHFSPRFFGMNQGQFYRQQDEK